MQNPGNKVTIIFLRKTTVKIEAGASSIHANYRNKILSQNSLELNNILVVPSSCEVLYVTRFCGLNKKIFIQHAHSVSHSVGHWQNILPHRRMKA